MQCDYIIFGADHRGKMAEFGLVPHVPKNNLALHVALEFMHVGAKKRRRMEGSDDEKMDHDDIRAKIDEAKQIAADGAESADIERAAWEKVFAVPDTAWQIYEHLGVEMMETLLRTSRVFRDTATAFVRQHYTKDPEVYIRRALAHGFAGYSLWWLNNDVLPIWSQFLLAVALDRSKAIQERLMASMTRQDKGKATYFLLYPDAKQKAHDKLFGKTFYLRIGRFETYRVDIKNPIDVIIVPLWAKTFGMVNSLKGLSTYATNDIDLNATNSFVRTSVSSNVSVDTPKSDFDIPNSYYRIVFNFFQLPSKSGAVWYDYFGYGNPNFGNLKNQPSWIYQDDDFYAYVDFILMLMRQ